MLQVLPTSLSSHARRFLSQRYEQQQSAPSGQPLPASASVSQSGQGVVVVVVVQDVLPQGQVILCPT